VALASAAACGQGQPTVDQGRGTQDVTVRIGEGRGGANVHYPIIAHPSQGGACDVVEWTRQRTHLKRGWTIEFAMRNNCDQAQDMGIVDNDSLFDSGPPTTVNVPGHDSRSFTLTVSMQAAYGNHKSDINLSGKKYDPDWQVDP
jgi:hypothetical protein